MPIVGQFGSLARAGSFLLPGGAFESIATVTVGSGGASSIEFTSIPGTYQHLQIRIVARTDRAGNTNDLMRLKANTDTGTNYAYHALFGNGSTAGASALTSEASAYINRATGATAASNVFGVAIVDILDYGSTSKNKTIRALGGWDGNGSGILYVHSGLWINSGTAISALTLTSDSSSNFVQHTTAALYGIKAP